MAVPANGDGAAEGGAAGTIGIWNRLAASPAAPPELARISLGEGDTPCQPCAALASELGLEELWLKREDLNPTGSHKDRGMAFQVSANLAGQGPIEPGPPRWLVISSSGNAAISAAAYARAAGFRLAAFVSPATPLAKLDLLAQSGAHVCVLITDRALGLAVATAERYGLPNLRPSTDPLAVEGFLSLGLEIIEQAPGADSVFTFVSSAASFVGVGRALATEVDQGPEMHAVQGGSACPIAGEFDAAGVAAAAGARGVRVGALGARKTRRVGEAKRIIVGSGGSGWVIDDAGAERASALLSRHGLKCALEGAASLAAAGRAAGQGRVRRPVVIITGAHRGGGSPASGPPGSQREVVGAPLTTRARFIEVGGVEDVAEALGLGRGQHSGEYGASARD